MDNVSDEVLLVVSGKGTATLCSLSNGGALRGIKDCSPTSGGLFANPQLALSVEHSQTAIHIWNWHKEQPEYRCQTPEKMLSVTCSSDGMHCLAGAVSGKLYLWQLGTGRLLYSWEAHFKACTAVITCLSDSYVITGGDDAIIHTWPFADLMACTESGSSHLLRPVRTWTTHTLGITSLSAAACGQHTLIASVSSDQTLRLWRLSEASKDCVFCVELGSPLTSVALHPTHAAAYAGGTNGRVSAVWLISPQRLCASACGSTLPSSTSKSHAAGGISAAPLSGSSTSALRDTVTTGAGIHSSAVSAVLATRNGKQVLSCAAQGGVWVWDARGLVLLTRLLPQQSAHRMVLLACPPALATSCPEASAARECVVAPLKKFAVPPPERASASTNEALGCVPVCLRTCEKHATIASIDWANQLPLLQNTFTESDADEGLDMSATSGPQARSPVVSLDVSSQMAAASLRAQLGRWEKINSNLFAMACEEQLASAMPMTL